MTDPIYLLIVLATMGVFGLISVLCAISMVVEIIKDHRK